MKKPTITGVISALAILLVVGVGSVAAYGYGVARNNGMDNDEIIAAVEAGDFSAWKEAHMAQLTEERFTQEQARYGQRNQMRTQHEEMEAALEAGDYDAWVAAHEDIETCMRNIDDISEEDFQIMVQMHEARESGDYETAHELAEDLGWETGMGLGRGAGQGMGRGMHSGYGMMR